MLECEDCGEPFCPECNAHYADCNCIGPTEDEVEFKEVDGVLFGTKILPPPKMIWANQTASGQNKLPPSKDRWKLRSTTYQGIADAMAAQWARDSRWRRVSFAADCIDLGGESLCSLCGEDYVLCPCFGPTQDGIEYEEFHGVLMGRQKQ
jgi:hypothetical protein